MNPGVKVPPQIRFWRFVNKTEGCWEWTGSIRHFGYGQFGVSAGVIVMAHRYSWILAGRELPPKGLVLMHSCDNPRCVRPDHLRVGTQRENVHDARDKGRMRGQFKTATECKRGHSFDEANTLIDGRGHKSCRTCSREKMRRRRAAERAVRVA